MKYQISSSLIALTHTHTEHAVTATRLSATRLRDLKLLQIKLDLVSLRSRTEKNCWTLVVNLYPFDLHRNKKQDDMLKWKIIYNGWKKGYSFFVFICLKGEKSGGIYRRKILKTKNNPYDIITSIMECGGKQQSRKNEGGENHFSLHQKGKRF